MDHLKNKTSGSLYDDSSQHPSITITFENDKAVLAVHTDDKGYVDAQIELKKGDVRKLFYLLRRSMAALENEGGTVEEDVYIGSLA